MLTQYPNRLQDLLEEFFILLNIHSFKAFCHVIAHRFDILGLESIDVLSQLLKWLTRNEKGSGRFVDQKVGHFDPEYFVECVDDTEGVIDE